MNAKKSDGKPEAGVRAAERALAEATAKVEANKSERETRLKEGQRLRRQLGEDPDGARAENLSARIVALQSRVAVLDADLPALEKAVQEAEAVVTAARKALAQSQVDAMAAELVGMSAQIVTALTEGARLISEHERVGIAMREVAEKHGLATPGKCRWLLPSSLIRSKGAELLRARLDVRHALGGIKEASARRHM